MRWTNSTSPRLSASGHHQSAKSRPRPAKSNYNSELRTQNPAVSPSVATAVWFPRTREVELRQEPLPPVGPGEVRVRAVASAISHGTEMLVYRGQVPPDLPLDLPALRGGFSFPIKYGYASVGRIEETGAGVTEFRVGDLVFVYHPHQDLYVVPASTIVPLPEGLKPEIGVFLANLETAVNVMLDAGVRLGERVVIFGQGVVGLLLTQLVRRVGADLIVVVDPLPLRRELALAVGADVALSPGDGLPNEIRALCDGVGADVALEASGNGEALGQAIESVVFQGTVVVCSWYGTKPVNLMLGGSFHRGRVRLVSSQVSNLDPTLQPRWSRDRRMRVARGLLGELRLEPLITQRVPFERADEAYRQVDLHPGETVQLLLTY